MAGRVGALLLVGATLALGACGTDDDSTPESAAGEASERSAPRSEANVVVIMTDDQTLAELDLMPATRRLIAGQGAEFENALVSFPLCCPSRATYLTGQYAHNNGVRSNSPEFEGGYARLDSERALPVWLQEAGYTTAQVGRYLNFYGVVDPNKIPPGWDQWVVPPGPSTYLMYGYDLNVNGEIVRHGDRPADYQTDVFARHAMAFIRRQGRDRERPFFLSITPLAPHDENDERVPSRFDGPRPAPRHRDALSDVEPPRNRGFNEADVSDKPPFVAELPRLSARKREEADGSFLRRARSLLAVDELVENVIGQLRRSDVLDNTYVIFTSDNGFLLGEHRLDGKITPYQETLRVPLLVRGPRIEPGSRLNGLAANIDLAPTIADIAAADPELTVDGISLLPALVGRRSLPRREILVENLDLARTPKQPLYTGIQTGRYSYVEYEQGEVEFYDLIADPAQLENLAADPASSETLARLAARLAVLRHCAGTTCRHR